MVVTGGHQVGKRRGIEPVVATWVELHGALAYLQKRRGSFVIGQHVAQAKERLPQIQKRFLFRLFRPEQTRQRWARMGSPRLHRQVGQ